MGVKEISVRSDVSFTFYFLLSTSYFLFSGKRRMKIVVGNRRWEVRR
ncbi:MAG: hypothetical protein AB1422_12540 [bacterium]